MPATRSDPQSVDCRVAGLLREPEGRRRQRAQNAAARPGSGRTGRSCPWRADLGARRQLGARSRRPSATRSRPRRRARGVEISAADVQQATRDSVRALMLIRAYRMRGHLHANLDPLGLEPPKDRRRARPAHLRLHRGRLRPQDLPRQRARPRVRRPCARSSRSCAAHLLPDARRRVHAHLRPGAEGLDAGAHRRAGQGDRLHPRRQARDPQQAGRGRGLREVLRRQVHRHQALRPRRRRIDDPGAGADHQARRRARRAGNRRSAWRIAAGSTCWRR